MAERNNGLKRLVRRWKRWRRQQQSAWHLWRARWRVRLTRPTPPSDAASASLTQSPLEGSRRTTRFLIAAALITVAVLVSAFIFQQRNPEVIRIAAELPDTPQTATPTSTATPTLTPTPTHTPTQTPTPTPATIFLTPFPTPDPLIGGGAIVFEMNVGGNIDLYALSIGQDRPIRLTEHPGIDRAPVWRPDGREIAFASNRNGAWDLYTLDLPTGELFQITDNLPFDGSPTWSPDGQWLVYESYQDNNLDIYVVRRDGSLDPIRLTEHPAPDYAPVWSPDGRHIAFTSLRSGNRDLFLLSLDELDDENAFNLTATTEIDEDQAIFQPFGEFLAYQASGNGLDTIEALPLNDNLLPSDTPITLGQGRMPAWSPNGETLIYTAEQANRSYLIASSLDAWAISPQTFASPDSVAHPSWSGVTFAPDPVGFIADLAESDPLILFTETISPTDDGLIPLVEVPVFASLDDDSADQTIQPFLSDAVDQSFLALRDRLLAESGWDLFADIQFLFEPISTSATLGESVRSWHKTGRAFDLDPENTLTFTPQLEVIPDPQPDGLYWRVYIRTALQDGTQGEPLRDRPWDFRARFGEDPRFYDQGGKLKDEVPTGYYVDLTTLAADYGWERIPAEENWRTFFEAANFWQFENRSDLTWEAAMLELYSAEEVDARFGE